MEAKDTVIQIPDNSLVPIGLISFKMQTEMLEKQAEISFKAGYEEGWKQRRLVEQPLFDDGEKAGIRKVVDWVKTHGYRTYEEEICLPPDDWQKQLKEWGIE